MIKGILLRKHNINLITPKRKNQKTKQKNKELNLLKKRSLVEHIFMFLKMKQRIQLRYDNSIGSYIGFIYLALIIPYYTKIKIL